MDGCVVRKQFVSWSDGEADREWAGLVALARHAPGLAPLPIRREVDEGAPVIVMSRIPGVPLGSEPLTPPQIEGLVTALRRLFAAPADPEAAERALGPSVMRSLVRGWTGEDHDLGECRDPGLVGRALHQAREWLSGDDPQCDRVIDPVLAVGDGNLANFLWDGTHCRLVDFEEFGKSDIAYELADVVEHASSRLRRLFDVDSFLHELELDVHQQRRLAFFRQVMATFWLVMLLPGNGGFQRNPRGSTEDQAEHVLRLLSG